MGPALTMCHGRGSPFHPPIANQPWAGPGNMPDQFLMIRVRQCSFAVPSRWSTASRTLSHYKLGRTVDMPPTHKRIESRTTCCHTQRARERKRLWILRWCHWHAVRWGREK
jgi:hypothetical protein